MQESKKKICGETGRQGEGKKKEDGGTASRSALLSVVECVF
jgi:hypothetical protein